MITESLPGGAAVRARAFLRMHGKKLWWLHSVYALVLGCSVVFFAQKGFEHARWLSVSLGAAWLLVVALFRLGATRAAHDTAAPTKAKLRFFVMTYVLKNLYQGMLFFLLPFYWKSSTLGSYNGIFVVLLAAFAVLSTIDLVFDRVLMRWAVVGALFHGLTLFACMNLVIPALLPETRTLYTLLSAAGAAVVGFWTIHLRTSLVKDLRYVALLVVSLALGLSGAYGARRGIPPVPMYMSSGAVGPTLLPDGRLAMEVTSLHAAVLREVIAVTDIVVPGGKGDRLVHVWRHDGVELHRAAEETSRVQGPSGAVRLRSALFAESLPEDVVGGWTVDVETDDGQLVGRVPFRVER
jgi:uncharacterized protein DUF5924/DUF2914 family protein